MISLKFTLNSVSFLFLLSFTFTMFLLNLLAISHNKRNIIVLLLCMELIFISISLNFAFISLIHVKFAQVLTLYVLTIAATESAIGLSLIINLYRIKQHINLKVFSSLRY